LEGGYHGDTVGAMSLGRSSGFFNAFESLLFSVETVSVPHTWTGHDPVSEEDRVLEGVSAMLAERGREFASLIVEPLVQGACGMRFHSERFLSALCALAHEFEIPVIFDEVMTGFRLARGGYQELCGIVPDMTALGKVIGGGLPVGAFGGRAEMMRCLSPEGPVYQAGTLSGNPLALSAGLAQLREMERLDGWRRLEEIGAAFEAGVRRALKRSGRNYNFRRVGSMFCLYFTEGAVDDLASAQHSDKAAFGRFFHGCRERGVYFAPSQFEAGFLSVAHTGVDLDEVERVSTEVLCSI